MFHNLAVKKIPPLPPNLQSCGCVGIHSGNLDALAIGPYNEPNFMEIIVQAAEAVNRKGDLDWSVECTLYCQA